MKQSPSAGRIAALVGADGLSGGNVGTGATAAQLGRMLYSSSSRGGGGSGDHNDNNTNNTITHMSEAKALDDDDDDDGDGPRRDLNNMSIDHTKEG